MELKDLLTERIVRFHFVKCFGIDEWFRYRKYIDFCPTCLFMESWPNDFISYAFSWRDTREGWNYWDDREEQWKEYLDKDGNYDNLYDMLERIRKSHG